MKNIIFATLVMVFCLSACNSYLEELPDAKLAVPKKIQDLKLLLNNALLYASAPSTPEILSDNYYVTSTSWNAVADEKVRNLYLWQREEHDSWNRMYRAIYHANTVLDHLPLIHYDTKREVELYQQVEGAAKFIRAFYYYWIMQIYTLPYERGTGQVGIPLRYDSDFNVKSKRYPLDQCYEQMISDLKESAALLPEKVSVKTEPSKQAAWGLLARIYLTLADYESAYHYADSSIRAFGIENLMDFNDNAEVDINANLPFKILNKEVIYYAMGSGTALINSVHAKIDSLLYNSYEDNDLRKKAFFKTNVGANLGTYSFKGAYGEGANDLFYGLALDEMMLTRAEAAARLDKKVEALEDVNLLLSKRWKGPYSHFHDDDNDKVLKFILVERRKSLLRRGLRWVDLRRLRNEMMEDKLPVRVIDGRSYTLDAKGKRMAVLIPYTVIDRSDLTQND